MQKAVKRLHTVPAFRPYFLPGLPDLHFPSNIFISFSRFSHTNPFRNQSPSPLFARFIRSKFLQKKWRLLELYNARNPRDLYSFAEVRLKVWLLWTWSLHTGKICWPILGIYKSLTWHMIVEIGAEAAQFPEKEFTNGIFVAVWLWKLSLLYRTACPGTSCPKCSAATM